MQYLVNAFPPAVLDAIGVAGFGFYVMNYTLLTFNKLQSKHLTFFVINWLAASMVLIGLMSSFNLASALIQIFWIIISTVGIAIRLRNGQATTTFQSTRAA